MTRVFISYKSEYRDFAIRLRDKLQDWGYDTWFDQDDIPPGEVFYIAIQDGLASSDAVLGIITPEALASRQVLAELHYGFEHDRLLPLLYRKAELIYFLSILSYIDFTADEATGFARLQQVLETNHPLLANAMPAQPAAAAPGGMFDLDADGAGDMEDITFGEALDAADEEETEPEVPRRRAEQVKKPAPAAAQPPAQSPPPPPAAAPEPKSEAQVGSAIVDFSAGMQRELLLYHVHKHWIEDVLEKESGRDQRIPPGALLRHEDYGDAALPADADIAEIYAGTQRELLILGPQSNDTLSVMLLLARSLLESTWADSAAPMPVVLDLESWPGEADSFEDWLIDSLIRSYRITRQNSRSWLDNDQLSLLLLGLDNVAEEDRERLLVQLAAFRQAHPQTDMVLSGRRENYAPLSDQLGIRSAILL